MSIYKQTFEQQIHGDLKDVWQFFSSPLNLKKITPPDLDFQVLSDFTAQDRIYPGMFIEYNVRPIAGIKMHWVTEITQVAHLKYFVDEQRKGPYKIWHHEHHFVPNDQGVHMTDILHYAVPLGLLGQLANRLFVHHEVQKIFQYRVEQIEQFFPS